MFAKAALRLRGHDAGNPRLPLPAANAEQVAAIAGDLTEAGVPLATAALGDLGSARVAAADAAAAYIRTTTHTSTGTVTQ